MSITFGFDPVWQAVEDALATLNAGGTVLENQRLDLKEEAGRREHGSGVVPGKPTNDIAARALTKECACMANTPGGGALIVGVADDSTLIGTALDEEWLRARIFELSQRHMTVDVRPVVVSGTRLLVLRVVEAVEPVRWNNRITWRVADRCVEIDASTWHERRRHGLQVDWSAQRSGLNADAVRPLAVEIARNFLRDSVDISANAVAESSTSDLLRRLNAVTGDGHLTNAAALLFVGRGVPSLDYIRRDAPGGQSTARVRHRDVALLEELQEVFTVAGAHNPIIHVQKGLAVGQTRQIPERSLREAVVNAVAHREWGVASPSLVEHVGNTLRVVSPGAFFGGVTPENIINHPSTSRNAALTELLASIRVAEREGIGIDLMVSDMLRLGYRRPLLHETETPSVEVWLNAETVDEAWIVWLASFDDSRARTDLRWLMSIDLLTAEGWFDLPGLAAYLQVPVQEAEPVVTSLSRVAVSGAPLLSPVRGIPETGHDAWALHPDARASLTGLYGSRPVVRGEPKRGAVARSYAQSRGRISSTELGSLLGISPSNVGPILKPLEDDGVLEPSRPNRRGAGFFYRFVG